MMVPLKKGERGEECGREGVENGERGQGGSGNGTAGSWLGATREKERIVPRGGG